MIVRRAYGVSGRLAQLRYVIIRRRLAPENLGFRASLR
jgi:hypothetical protein